LLYLRLFTSRYARLAALAAGVVGLAFCAFIAHRAWREEYQDFERWPTQAITRHPERTGIAGLKEIAFSAPGDAPIAAWYAPSRNRAAVILLHGTEAERSSLLAETRLLATAGFGVLALDAPGQGGSGGVTLWGPPERRALSAAVEWLTHRDDVDANRIGAFGLSMGAYVLAQAAVSDQRIAAVVLASPVHDVDEFAWEYAHRWGWLAQVPAYLALRLGGTPLDMRPKDIVWQIAPRPLLLVHGDRDPLVREWMVRQIFDNAREPKERYEVHGAGHSDAALVSPVEYGAHLVEFFSRTLLAQAAPAAAGADAASAPQQPDAAASAASAAASAP
jgi:uncharacterized protein